MVPGSSVPSSGASPYLVGREPAVRLLLTLWQEVTDQRLGRFAVITGDAGVGKTTLARAVVDAVPAAPPVAAPGGKSDVAAWVLWGNCGPATDTPPLWPWRQIVRAARHVPQVADTFGELFTEGVGSEVPDRLLTFGRVVTGLTELAELCPLIVVLDDLHRADEASMRLLRFLMPQLFTVPLLIIATSRSSAVQDQALYGDTTSRATEVALTGLGIADTEALLWTRGHGEIVARVAEVHEPTGGNPFLLDSFLRLIDAGLDVDTALRGVADRRLGLLPAACRQILGLAALAAEDATPSMLASLTGTDDEQILRTVRPALAAGVIRVGDGRLEFGHDLDRERAMADFGGDAQAAVHRRIADQLRSATATQRGRAARLARHLLAAGTHSPQERDQLLDWLELAAAEARSRGDHAAAAAALTQAGNMAGHTDDLPRRRRLRLLHAQVLLSAGEHARARQVIEPLIEDADLSVTGDELAEAALVVHRAGANIWDDQRPTTSLIDRAVRLRGDRRDPLQARLLAGYAEHLAQIGQPDHARLLADRAVELAESLGEPELLAHCLQSKISAIWSPGTAPARRQLAQQMASAAESVGKSTLVVEARLAGVSALLELGDPAFHAGLDLLQVLVSRTPHPHLQWLVLTRRVIGAIVSGDLTQAAELLDDEDGLGTRLQEPDLSNVVGGHRAQLSYWQVGLVETYRQVLSQPEASAHPSMLATRDCLNNLARDDRDAAAAILRTRIEPLLADLPAWTGLGWQCAMAHVAVLAGAHDACHRFVPRLAPFADTFAVGGGAADFAGPVAYYLGLLSGALGQTHEALLWQRAAHQRAAKLGARLFVGLSSCRIAELLPSTQAGRLEAETLLDAADDIASQTGSAHLATEVAQARTRLDPWSPRPAVRRDREGWTWTFDGDSVHLPDVKGLHDLALLVQSPWTSLPATDLFDGIMAQARRLGADQVLDERARAAYRRRLNQLADEEIEADHRGDVELSVRVQVERDQIVDALRSASGLGGRTRLLGDATERARKAVTARIRDAIRRIGERHAVLGAHLAASVRTGTSCSYEPTPRTTWDVDFQIR